MDNLIVPLIMCISVVVGHPNPAPQSLNVLNLPINCRDIPVCLEILKRNGLPLNVVTVPPNCAAGQELINGECRDIWRQTDHKNVITVPPNCPSGQEYINGQCREIWRQNVRPVNVVTVPPNCPAGQELINGECRDIWKQPTDQKNVVSVPPNCPSGQEYINGQCRDIWSKLARYEAINEILQKIAYATKFHVDVVKDSRALDFVLPEQEPAEDIMNKNIISVPNQCPSGFKPDANGVCREIWD